MNSAALLAVEGLSVTYTTGKRGLTALDCVDFSIAPGETLALVGESGSGKTTVAMAIMGLLDEDAFLAGRIEFQGLDLAKLRGESRRSLRGSAISLVLQDPFTSLNPSLPVGTQVAEPLIYHRGVSKKCALERSITVLGEVGLRNAEIIARAYPHQLSGGMRQRVLIATALINDPLLLILDEPTTALDITVEAQILELLAEIKRRRALSMLYITHNMRVVNRIADRICVLYAGRVLEVGPKCAILRRPAHPYTKGLLSSLPRMASKRERKRLSPIAGRFPDLTRPLRGCIFEPRCPFSEEIRCSEPQRLIEIGANRFVRCWKACSLIDEIWPVAPASKATAWPRAPFASTPLMALKHVVKIFPLGATLPRLVWQRWLGVPAWPRLQWHSTRAVDGVTAEISQGEILGLVGESGSGKSTLGRLALRLIEPSRGRVVFKGEDVTEYGTDKLREFRKSAQIVFQNPESSLNPRRAVGEAIARAAWLATGISGARLKSQAEELLDKVGLPKHYYDRYPHELSGGEKQRVGIARALATGPKFIVCDEPVSALDVSVQATVLNLLEDLRDGFGLSYLFISHDLAVVAYLADRIGVMYAGRICEIGPTDSVLEPPYHPYTEVLLSATAPRSPVIGSSARRDLVGDVPSVARISGCPYHSRCPRKLGTLCETVPPPSVEAGFGHKITCHIPPQTLRELPPIAS
jgi:peptide/nickel transport system ATP-binding protein